METFGTTLESRPAQVRTSIGSVMRSDDAIQLTRSLAGEALPRCRHQFASSNRPLRTKQQIVAIAAPVSTRHQDQQRRSAEYLGIELPDRKVERRREAHPRQIRHQEPRRQRPPLREHGNRSCQHQPQRHDLRECPSPPNCHAKNSQLHKPLSSSCSTNRPSAGRVPARLPRRHTNQTDTAIIPYNTVHTGPNNQPGGAHVGRCSSA